MPTVILIEFNAKWRVKTSLAFAWQSFINNENNTFDSNVEKKYMTQVEEHEVPEKNIVLK